jgi:hypothetical protein
MDEKPAKKPRTEAQKVAFLRAQKCRQEAIIRKHEEEQKRAQAAQDELEKADLPMEDAAGSETQALRAAVEETQAGSETQEQGAVEETVVLPIEHSKPVQEAAAVAAADDDYDFVEFDPEELRSQLQTTQAELQALKTAVDGLHGKHSDLESTWANHNVRQANMLNFV